MIICPTQNATLRVIAVSLRRSFIAAKRVAMNADSRDGGAMAHWVSAAPREGRGCGESEALQDDQGSHNRRDDNAHRWESICPASNHVTFDILSKGHRQRE
jgi:hypothetical protein